LCKKPQDGHLAAGTAKEYFFEAPILFILRSKMNKIGASKNFISLPKAVEISFGRPQYFSQNVFLAAQGQLLI